MQQSFSQIKSVYWDNDLEFSGKLLAFLRKSTLWGHIKLK